MPDATTHVAGRRLPLTSTFHKNPESEALMIYTLHAKYPCLHSTVYCIVIFSISTRLHNETSEAEELTSSDSLFISVQKNLLFLSKLN